MTKIPVVPTPGSALAGDLKPHPQRMHNLQDGTKAWIAVCGGRPIRVFYAPDPRRTAIQLMEGKKGDDRPYDKHVSITDDLSDEHIKELRKEGLL